jgi:hypothetical protein
VLIEAWRRHYNTVRPQQPGLPAAAPEAATRRQRCTNNQTGPLGGGRSPPGGHVALSRANLEECAAGSMPFREP